MGIPEGAEASCPTKFMAEFIPEIMGAEHFPTPVEIDRDHRSLALKPKKGARPRPINLRLHNCSQKERIMGLAKRRGPLIFRDTPVHIYRDLPAEISKLRATFNAVKAKPREGKIEYSLYYPVILAIYLMGVRHTFVSPQVAKDF